MVDAGCIRADENIRGQVRLQIIRSDESVAIGGRSDVKTADRPPTIPQLTVVTVPHHRAAGAPPCAWSGARRSPWRGGALSHSERNKPQGRPPSLPLLLQ